MSKTMADHARAYRQRKAAKLARLAVLEEALREIEHAESKEIARFIAKRALNHTTEAREEGA